MKKRIVIVTSIVLVLLLVIAHFIPSYKQEKVLIVAPILHAAQELNSPGEWQRWNPYLRKYCIENASACAEIDNRVQNNFTVNAGQHSFTIAAHGASYDVTEKDNGNTTLYNYTIVSTIYNDTTTVFITENTNLLSSLFSDVNTNALKYADNLKSFIENPSAFYGFPLVVSTTIDTLVVSTHSMVLSSNGTAALKEMYKKLDDFIQTNHLKVVHPKIARFEGRGNDSVNLSVAVPVDKMVPINSANKGIEFLAMPTQAHMMVGTYKGKFSERTKLYQAIYKYLDDKRLKRYPGTEYDEYLNNIIPESDSSIVDINVCVPYL
jgi:predicted transcriptional regulator YdeE